MGKVGARGKTGEVQDIGRGWEGGANTGEGEGARGGRSEKGVEGWEGEKWEGRDEASLEGGGREGSLWREA